MIEIRIRELLLAKGMKASAYTLQRFGIGRSAAKHYLSGKAKSITTEHLFKMCVLLNCTPKEIFKVILDPTDLSLANTPIADWADVLAPLHIGTLRGLSPEQLVKAKKAIDEIVNSG